MSNSSGAAAAAVSLELDQFRGRFVATVAMLVPGG